MSLGRNEPWSLSKFLSGFENVAQLVCRFVSELPLTLFLCSYVRVLVNDFVSLQTAGSVLSAKRKEDEMSVGSTPLAKHPSNQASDYASSPVKTKTVTGMLTKPWNMSLFLMFFFLSLVEQQYGVLSPSIKALFWCSDICFIGDPRVCCHLSKAVKLRTQHILHCFPLLILWWAVDAQNRWVAWLCWLFLTASFPLSETPSHKSKVHIQTRAHILTHCCGYLSWVPFSGNSEGSGNKG